MQQTPTVAPPGTARPSAPPRPGRPSHWPGSAGSPLQRDFLHSPAGHSAARSRRNVPRCAPRPGRGGGSAALPREVFLTHSHWLF